MLISIILFLKASGVAVMKWNRKRISDERRGNEMRGKETKGKGEIR